VAVEDIGGLYNTKQPGYDDTADIQAALKAFLYGDYDYDITRTDTNFPNPSLARHLQLLSNRVTAQETLGIGSDYLTLAQIGALVSPTDGYIAMASDSNGGAVESLYASAFYTNEAPTTDLVDGILWVDKDSAALDTYIYDSTLLPGDPWVRINDLKNIIAAKGDLLVGTAAEGLDNLTVGANGTVLTADDTQALGVKWQAPSVYSQPTLGTTAIASGATVSNVNNLTINSTTIPTSKTLVATDSTAYVIPSMSGNAGKYLTNDGSTPSWATSSSGGQTLITTSSFPTSGTATHTISSIPTTYKHLLIIIKGVKAGTGSDGVANFTMQFNGDTGANYASYSTGSTSGGSIGATNLNINARLFNSADAHRQNYAIIDIPRYTDTDARYITSVSYGIDQNTVPWGYWNSQVYKGSSAITSITFTAGANFAGGTAYVYGVS
jgi:hypothetical protein